MKKIFSLFAAMMLFAGFTVAADAPTAAPNAPEYPIYQVKAVYSATYEADCDFGEWGSGTQYTQEEFGKKFVTGAMGYFGLAFESRALDCSEMEALHLDAWIASDASIRVVPIHGGTEVGVTVNLVGQQWNSINIPLSAFEGVTNWTNVYQIKIDNASNLTFWLNNVYFYTSVAPVLDLENGYYLIGQRGWTVYDLKASDKFIVNPENDAEYVLVTTLAEGDEFKVVNVQNNEIPVGGWFPAEGGNYKVDFAHAGEKNVYFRPDYQGGADWFYGCIFVPETKDANPYETWFASYDTWNTETESYLEWDAEAKKATVHINVDKYGQWRAQVKYHGPVAEEGKCYHFGLKMKANHEITGVTIKYQDDVEMVYVDDAVLPAGEEFVFERPALEGKANGNGIMVLDFGWAKAGDVIEIYDVIIEEAECGEPEPVEYYLVGTMTDWQVVTTDEYHFISNVEAEGEYVLAANLTVGQGIKVVGVKGSAQTWFPDGMGNEYIVDEAHAGLKTIYFRPEYNAEWAAFGGYIWIEANDQAIDNTNASVKAVKFFENGQLIILKNGVRYNAQGAVVK